MITKEDFNFLKSRKSKEVKGSGENLTIISNPLMKEICKKSFEELNELEEKSIALWVKQYKEKNQKAMIPFVLSEDEVIKNKVFPMDYQDDLFYYGLLLPKNIDNEIKGKKIGKKQIWSPVLISSRRELLEYTERLKEDLGINFETIPTMLPRRWRLEDIRNYLYGEPSELNNLEILNKIAKQYETYLYIRNPTWYKIHALWDLGTYLYQLFEAYPFFELRGIAGTGKTQAMTISAYITFNGGQIMANPSESTLFRETDEVRGTKYFDEAEKLWVYNKSTKQYEGDVRTELINASYTKEAKVPRQEKVLNKFVTKWYSPYSPTQLGSINGLYGATETRAITRITTKSSNNDNRGELEPAEDRQEDIWAEIRDMCYRFSLTNWKEIKKLYNNFPKDIGLKRRDYQIWKPLLTLAKFISENLFKEVVEFAKEITERRTQDLITESSFDYMCLEALRNTIKISSTDKIYVDSIKTSYCNLKGDEGDNNIYLNRNISSHLDKLGFKELRGRDKKASYFAVNQEIYNEIVAPICPNLAFSSTSSTLSTPLSINNKRKGGDGVVIGGDKENEKVVMVAIDGENVDNIEQEDLQKAGYSDQEIKKILGDLENGKI